MRDLHQDWDPQVWARIDRAVAEAYGIGENARKRLEEVHLLPGVEHPGK